MSHLNIHKSKKPSKTVRYCSFCEDITPWDYNRTTGHSECSKCGGTRARKVIKGWKEKYLKKELEKK
jgi:DNA polymerase II large subunit